MTGTFGGSNFTLPAFCIGIDPPIGVLKCALRCIPEPSFHSLVSSRAAVFDSSYMIQKCKRNSIDLVSIVI